MSAPNRVNQGTSAVYTATLVDENEDAIPLAQIPSLKLTLYNADTPEPSPASGNILNSRNLQDLVINGVVQSGTNVTYHATSGLLTWTMQAADNPIVNESLTSELHVARFDFTYGSPAKPGSHEVKFRVTNLRKV